jgi:hypothetical protein
VSIIQILIPNQKLPCFNFVEKFNMCALCSLMSVNCKENPNKIAVNGL